MLELCESDVQVGGPQKQNVHTVNVNSAFNNRLCFSWSEFCDLPVIVEIIGPYISRRIPTPAGFKFSGILVLAGIPLNACAFQQLFWNALVCTPQQSA